MGKLKSWTDIQPGFVKDLTVFRKSILKFITAGNSEQTTLSLFLFLDNLQSQVKVRARKKNQSLMQALENC